MTIQEIFAYANTLAENNFEEMNDIIEFLNEAQDVVARFDPLKSQPYYTMVTEQGIMLPADLLRVHQIIVDDVVYHPKEPAWGGMIATPELTLGALVKILYYVRPAVLLPSIPQQEPRVPKQYHRAMASYAARMFYLIDDDGPLREAFQQQFQSQLASLKSSDDVVSQFINF